MTAVQHAGLVAIAETRLPHATVHAGSTWLPHLAALVREHGSLYDWAASQPQPRALRGRAPVYVAQLPDGGPQVVVRHAWHGGLLAPVTQDVFRRPTRAPIEMARSAELHRLGIPTTEVLGYALYDAAFGLVRVDVVTRYVDNTADLGMVLAGLVPAIECEAALTATLELLERLAVHGVVHPDLNVKNILLQTTTGSSPRALVIDVDVVHIETSTPDRTMQRNVARLTRSLHKWNRQFGCDLADARIAEFAAAAMARTSGTRS
ncbi:lipopolysaccharide kinase InaA family protein [Gemmatimonas sp.]